MDALLHGIKAVSLILMLISVGYFSGKTKLCKPEYKPFFTKFIINIAVPAMCVNNIFGQFAEMNLNNPLFLFLPAIISLFVTLLIGIGAEFLFKIPPKRKGAFIVMCAFSNSMFIGLPLCKELFGEKAVPYVIAFYIVNTLMFWSFGTALIQRSAADNYRFSFPQFLKRLANPPLISLLISIVLVSFKVKLPSIAMSFCDYLGSTVSPLALFYVGFVISEAKKSQVKEKLDLSMLFMLIIRFIVAPIITFYLCIPFGVSGIAQNVFVAEAAMPVMIQCVIVSGAYGGDEKYAANALTVSTLLCLLVMPVLYALLV